MRFMTLLFTLAIMAIFAVDVGAATTVVGQALPAFHFVGHAGATLQWASWAVFSLGVALGTGNLTLLDQAKRLDPNGSTATIVELLNQTNEVLDDMTYIEGNLPTGHRTTIRTGLPAVAWRLLNQGVVPSKSTTAQIDEQAGMLEAWSEVDKDLMLLNGNSASFRLSEASAFLEAMNQEMARVLFYGNAGVAPEQFTGLSPRYSLSTAPNGDNVIKAGGVGADNTSIWLVAWGDSTVTGIFPQGSKAGLIHEDFGEVTIDMVAGMPGARMRGLQERFQWKNGIAVKDWRYAVRICNIDVSDLLAANVKTLLNFLEQAVETIPDRRGKPVIYMNRTMRRMLRKEARESVSTGGGLTFDNYEGKRIMMFGDIPIRIVDQLLNTEALVP
jgi:Major capsid protein GP7